MSGFLCARVLLHSGTYRVSFHMAVIQCNRFEKIYFFIIYLNIFANNITRHRIIKYLIYYNVVSTSIFDIVMCVYYYSHCLFLQVYLSTSFYDNKILHSIKLTVLTNTLWSYTFKQISYL